MQIRIISSVADCDCKNPNQVPEIKKNTIQIQHFKKAQKKYYNPQSGSKAQKNITKLALPAYPVTESSVKFLTLKMKSGRIWIDRKIQPLRRSTQILVESNLASRDGELRSPHDADYSRDTTTFNPTLFL